MLDTSAGILKGHQDDYAVTVNSYEADADYYQIRRERVQFFEHARGGHAVADHHQAGLGVHVAGAASQTEWPSSRTGKTSSFTLSSSRQAPDCRLKWCL